MSAADPLKRLFNRGVVELESPGVDLYDKQARTAALGTRAGLRRLGGPRAMIRSALARIPVFLLLLCCSWLPPIIASRRRWRLPALPRGSL